MVLLTAHTLYGSVTVFNFVVKIDGDTQNCIHLNLSRMSLSHGSSLKDMAKMALGVTIMHASDHFSSMASENDILCNNCQLVL